MGKQDTAEKTAGTDQGKADGGERQEKLVWDVSTHGPLPEELRGQYEVVGEGDQEPGR